MTVDFSAAKAPPDWVHGEDRYQELRSLWLWKQKWGYGDGFVVAGNRPRTSDPRRVQEAPAVLRRPREGERDERLQVPPPEEGVRPPETVDYDPLAAPLAQSIMGRLRNRWAVDRTAAHDQISGVAYTNERRGDLAKLVGEDHYLVMEYGLRTITDLNALEKRSGLRIDHDKSSPYQRDELDLDTRLDRPVESMFEGLYAQAKTEGMPDFDPAKVFFVNAGNVPQRLSMIYGEPWTAPDGETVLPAGAQMHEIKPGFHALCFPQALDEKQRKALTGNMLPGIGATPSSYQVLKETATFGKDVPDPLSDPRLNDPTRDNGAALKAPAVTKACTRLETLPEDHPMRTIGNATARMVRGVDEALETRKRRLEGQIGVLRQAEGEHGEELAALQKQLDGLKENKLIGSALENIQKLMGAMPSYMDDIPRFSRLFDVLVDEVYLAMAIAKPYELDDYKNSAKASLARRAPTLETMADVRVEPFLVSSGMDTIASGLVAAKEALGGRGDKIDLLAREDKRRARGANYFEVQFNMLGDHTLGEGTPLVMGTLNPSTPTRRMNQGSAPEWSADSLIEGIGKMIGKDKNDLSAPATGPSPEKPTVVVLDITVEKGTDDELDKIMKAFKVDIEDGRLQLVLCKSYQKFPSLGSGKAMAGGVTVIGKGECAEKLSQSLRAAERSENIIGNDETQLVCHFTEHESDMERPMLDRAAKNAKSIRGLLPESVGGNKKLKFLYAEDLPFVAIPDQKIKFKGGEQRPDDLLHRLGVENRFSFGFQNTSCLPFPEGVRIGAGQESEAELMEKLYTVMKLVDPARGNRPVEPKDLAGMAGDAAASAVGSLSDAVLGDGGSGADKLSRREALLKQAVAQGLVEPGEMQKLAFLSEPPVAAYNTVVSEVLRDIKPDPADNAAWRSQMAQRLLDCGALDVGEVARDRDTVTSICGEKEPGRMDDLLRDLLTSLHATEAVEINGRVLAPEALAQIQTKFVCREADALLRPLLLYMQDPSKPVPKGCKKPTDPLLAQLSLISGLTGRQVDDTGGDPEVLAEAYGETASNLLKRRNEDPDANETWRDDILRRLLGAGALKESDLVRGEGGAAVSILGKDTAQGMDEVLRQMLEQLHSRQAVEIEGRRFEPQELRAIQSRMTGRRDDDVNRMHASQSQGWKMPGAESSPQSREAAFLPNIVACCALTSEAVFTDAAGLEAFRTLADPVIETSLDQLSPEMRQRLLQRRGEASLRMGAGDPSKPGTIDKTVEEIATFLKKQPYREGGANLLQGEALAEVLNGWPETPPPSAEERKTELAKIVAACTRELDLRSERDMLMRLIESADALKRSFDETATLRRELDRQRKNLDVRLKLARGNLEALQEAFGGKVIMIGGKQKKVSEFQADAQRVGARIQEKFRAKLKREAEELKKQRTAIEQGIAAAHLEFKERLEEGQKRVETATTSLAEVDATIRKMARSTQAMKPHLRMAEVMAETLAAKLETAKTSPPKVAPIRMGGIPLGGDAAPQPMDAEEVKEIAAEVEAARKRLAVLKERIG